MRLFVAIPLKRECYNQIQKMQAPLTGMKGIMPVPLENCHLTLKFLGDVNEPVRDKIIKGLATVHQQPFEIRITEPGCFPDLKNPRVVFAGCEPTPELVQLANDIDAATNIIKNKYKKFSPHITIARVKDVKLPGLRAEPCAFIADEFFLMESKPTSTGRVYKVLQRFTL
ncbi:RNA 2',3'-cyclic phosphodiesterase, partial [Candidatus Woesearchaeota archaeon]|nr:RNA 2',3'-cyclic phosphodiesterase [Candidatus Woesearchaeota archaeon]